MCNRFLWGDDICMKNNKKIAASIDIGSSLVRMKIAQASNNAIDTLETLEHPLNVGRETFTHNKIRFSTMESGAKILSNYYNLAHGLGVVDENISLTATTALREALNKDYVCDQIMVKTGHVVTIFEDGEEKTYIFREMLKHVVNSGRKPEYYVLSYIGTGSIGIALCHKNKIIYSQNIRIGSLKLNEVIDEMNDYDSSQYLAAIDEYIQALFEVFAGQIKKYKIDDFYISGKEVNLIAFLCPAKNKEKFNILNKKQMDTLYNSVRDKSVAELKSVYSISSEQAEILLPSLVLYRKMLSITSTQKAYIIDVSLCDALLYKTLFPNKFKQWRKDFEKSSIASAEYIAEEFNYSKPHTDTVKNFSLEIFDNLKKLHGFSRRERLYLEIAAIMHDIGKSFNSKSHQISSANMILDSYIIGIDKQELAIIANIARYHSIEVPMTEHATYAALSVPNRIIVSKLSAIIRLADALDRSHMQKIKNISLRLKDNTLTIKTKCNKDIMLEKWTFNKKANFFEEVFGIKCDLINRS